MQPEAVEVWVMATGNWWKLHRVLCSLYPVRSSVRVVMTDSGNEEKNLHLQNVCAKHGVGCLVRPWCPIAGGAREILAWSLAEEVIILCHDDVIFPPWATTYIEELVTPIRTNEDVAIVGGKIWDAFYGKINAHGQGEFPGNKPYPSVPMAVSCVHSACMAIRPGVEMYANAKAEFDFERVLSYGAWENGKATLYWPTTEVLWHEKGGTVDFYHDLPKVAGHIVDVTRKTDKGTGFDEMWWDAYGESPRDSLDKMGAMAEKYAGTEMERFRKVADGFIFGSPVSV